MRTRRGMSRCDGRETGAYLISLQVELEGIGERIKVVLRCRPWAPEFIGGGSVGHCVRGM